MLQRAKISIYKHLYLCVEASYSRYDIYIVTYNRLDMGTKFYRHVHNVQLNDVISIFATSNVIV